MSAWDGLGRDGGGLDFISLYISKSQTPKHKMNGQVSELSFSPSPTKTVVDPNAFCRPDNVQECVLYLNQEITTMGMPSLYEGSTSVYDITRVINCMYDLVQRHQRSSRLREELENRIHRLETDEAHSRLTQGRLKSSMEDTRRQLGTAEEQARQATSKAKLLTNKLKAEKEEVRRLQSEGHRRYTQFKHDISKKEREAIKLKERLNQLLSDKCQEKKIGMEISEALQRTDGKRGTWQKRNKQDEDLHREVISNYEHRQKELMVENGELRQCVSACVGTLQKELVSLVNDHSISIHHTDLSDSDDDISVESESNSELADAHFEMPCDFMRENLEKNMMEKCRKLKKYVKRFAKSKSSSVPSSASKPCTTQSDEKHQKELERLHKQIDRYREIIEQQELLIQQSLVNAGGSSPPRSVADALEDLETLHVQQKLFSQQKSHFEDERRAYTEAAIRLSRENSEDDIKDEVELVPERRELFEKERATYLAQQVLQMTPFSENSSVRLRPHSPEKTHLMPGIAAFSPAPNVKSSLATPSTADLYRSLGLTPREARNQQASAFASPALKRNGIAKSLPSPTADHTSPLSACSSPSHHARISEHAHNVKMAVFNRETASPDNPRSPHS